MMKRIKQTTTDGGLVLVETEEEAPTPPNSKGKCGHCGKPSNGEPLPFGWKTPDGFFMPHPTCGHGRYLECPDCRPKYQGCPVCGEKCKYT